MQINHTIRIDFIIVFNQFFIPYVILYHIFYSNSFLFAVYWSM